MEEAKEKAIELFNIYKKYYDDEKAKQKAHAMVNRLIKSFKYIRARLILNTKDNSITIKNMKDDIVFYRQVKIELNKL